MCVCVVCFYLESTGRAGTHSQLGWRLGELVLPPCQPPLRTKLLEEAEPTLSQHCALSRERGGGRWAAFVCSSPTSLHVSAAVTAQAELRAGAPDSLQGPLTGRYKVQASQPGLSSAS